MGLASVRGIFTEFDGFIEIGEDLSTARAYGRVSVDSLDTNQPQRDEHLRSPDFFDVAQYPELRFESTAITALDEQTYRITGEAHHPRRHQGYRPARRGPGDGRSTRGATTASGSRSPDSSRARTTG